MKTKYVLATVAAISIAIDLCSRFFDEDWFLTANIQGTLNALLRITIVLLIYAIVRDIIKFCIRQEQDKKARETKKLRKIEREMDEIEASLDAVTNNEKITPIWELPRKEP